MPADAEFEDHMRQLAPELATVMRSVRQVVPYDVLYSFRDDATQADLNRRGVSQLGPGKSKHNVRGADGLPAARAVDIRMAPFPGWGALTQANGKDLNARGEAAFNRLAGAVLYVAASLGIRVIWGGDWRGFRDVVHFELADKT